MLSLNTVVFFSLVASTNWQAQTQQVSLAGQVHGLYVGDYNGDNWPDLLVVNSRATQRFIDVYDGQNLAQHKLDQPKRLAVPREVSFFDLCPALGPGLLWLKAGKIERLAPDGVLHTVVTLPAGSYTFVEQADLERIPICVAQAKREQNAQQKNSLAGPVLMIPGLGQTQVLRDDGKMLNLQAPQQVFMVNGQHYRGPRARRDMSLMTMLISPRQQAGHILNNKAWNLTMTQEDRLLVFSAPSLEGENATGKIAPSLDIRIGPRTLRQRQRHIGLSDIQLYDFTGDGVEDALVSFQQGQSSDMRSRWQVIAGPLDKANAKSIIADEKFAGLANPLMPVDVDSDGIFELLEPRIDTGVMNMGKALMTGSVAVHYRLHRFLQNKHQRSARWTLKQTVHLTGHRSFSAQPPILQADFNGDGFRDFVDLGQDKKLQLFAGQQGLQTYDDDASLEQKIPASASVVSLRQGRLGAAALAVLQQSDNHSSLQIIYIENKSSR